VKEEGAARFRSRGDRQRTSEKKEAPGEKKQATQRKIFTTEGEKGLLGHPRRRRSADLGDARGTHQEGRRRRALRKGKAIQKSFPKIEGGESDLSGARESARHLL